METKKRKGSDNGGSKKENAIYDFTKLKVENVNGETEALDVARIVGNIYYNNTPDIGQMDKAREIFHKGKTELTPEECQYFERAILQSEMLPAPIKVAIQKMFKEE
ncbi:hypothetical protein [Parabacteroides sp. PF5-9]|uniref:hypothetical protein n=1 Tax=Parabacteroides sp. PF5-9 TaxID=1742404 RepID=UPI00247578C4|nr:hypothetical protein [Parabacteroides sp. PF5-9]MDH6357246.1 hypothetical protein [Parabacteroides sp. PF5-9]